MRRKEPEDEAEIEHFTPEQRKRLLKMLEAHERAAWLWSTVGIWLKWLGVVLAALVAVKVLVADYIKNGGR